MGIELSKSDAGYLNSTRREFCHESLQKSVVQGDWANQKSLAGTSPHRSQSSSDQKWNTPNRPHEHLRRLLLAHDAGEFWDGYDCLHQSASSARFVGMGRAMSSDGCARRELQASKTIPMKAHRRSRTRRVRANERPSIGENPMSANAEIAPPSSEPRRAGIHPLSIFSPRVTPSMTRIVKK